MLKIRRHMSYDPSWVGKIRWCSYWRYHAVILHIDGSRVTERVLTPGPHYTRKPHTHYTAASPGDIIMRPEEWETAPHPRPAKYWTLERLLADGRR